MAIAQIPISLYAHFPWCLHKCPYCDFNSHQLAGPAPEKLWLEALFCDLEEDLPLFAGRPLASVFIGGGTPSLLSPEAVASLLDGLRSRCQLAADTEITMEANPGSLESGQLRDYAAAGVNRISLGAQSFHEGHLRLLERIHSGAEARRAIEEAAASAFRSFNVDLLYGLPNQDPAQAIDDLRLALELGAPHISWYQLTIEPNTVFYKHPPSLPGEEVVAETEQAGHSLLADAGLARYEVSAYGRPGHECQHNLNYWNFGDYLGIGPGAHGKSTGVSGEVTRRWKTRQPGGYLARRQGVEASFLAGKRKVSGRELAQEFLLGALRLPEGVSEDLFIQRTGLDLQALEPWRERGRHRGLLRSGAVLAATPLGFGFLDDLLAAF